MTCYIEYKLALNPRVAQAEVRQPKLRVGQRTLDLSPPAIRIREVTQVPLRPAFEALCAEVTWDAQKREATVRQGERVLRLKAGQRSAWIGEQEIKLPRPLLAYQGEPIVPLDPLAIALGTKVRLDEATMVAQLIVE